MFFEESTELVLKGSIEEFVISRNEMMERVDNLLKVASKFYEPMARVNALPTYPPRICVNTHGRDSTLDASSAQEMKKEINTLYWLHVINTVGIVDYMDEQQRKEFHESVRKNELPDLTVENIQSTLNGLKLQAHQIFRRGIVNVFKHLDRKYRSNDSFRISDKVVITRMIDVSVYCGSNNERKRWMHLTHSRECQLEDIDRMMHIVDGKKPPENTATLAKTIRDKIKLKDGEPGEFENEYYKIKWFLNGNGHIQFKQRKLVDRINKILAEELGPVLPKSNRRAS